MTVVVDEKKTKKKTFDIDSTESERDQRISRKSSPESAVEEGRIGTSYGRRKQSCFRGITCEVSSYGPLNYPVGKPLEVSQ